MFLFHQITKSGKGEYLRKGGAVSYTTMREQFKKNVKELGYPADVFGLHSLRAGGAPMQECQTICAKDMEGGGRIMQKMVI